MECVALSVCPEERRWSVLPLVWTQKKGDGICCHECLPRRKEIRVCCHECLLRRKELEYAAMSVCPEEKIGCVLP